MTAYDVNLAYKDYRNQSLRDLGGSISNPYRGGREKYFDAMKSAFEQVFDMDGWLDFDTFTYNLIQKWNRLGKWAKKPKAISMAWELLFSSTGLPKGLKKTNYFGLDFTSYMMEMYEEVFGGN